jgi:nitroreductase
MHEKTDSLEKCIRQRHSVRAYLPDPVPKPLLYECLSLAQFAPSNSNIQNWRIFFASDPAAQRIKDALMDEVSKHGPNVPPLPAEFQHFRSEFGSNLYSKGYHIARDDKRGRQEASQRNFRFFDAPTVGVVCMDASLHPVDAMSVGMYLQTLILLLTERGLGTCAMVSIAGFQEVVKKEFGVPEKMVVLCGLSVGWPDEENDVNKVFSGREEVEHNVTFLDE